MFINKQEKERGQYLAILTSRLINNPYLLDDVEQNVVICQRRADQLFAEAIVIDLQYIDKSRYCAITMFNNCFIIRPPLLSQYSHFSFAQLKMSNQSLTALELI